MMSGACSARDAGLAGRAVAALAFVHHAGAGALRHTRRAVVRAVVDDDDLVDPAGNVGDDAADRPFLVEGRNDDADLFAVSHRASSGGFGAVADELDGEGCPDRNPDEPHDSSAGTARARPRPKDRRTYSRAAPSPSGSESRPRAGTPGMARTTPHTRETARARAAPARRPAGSRARGDHRCRRWASGSAPRQGRPTQARSQRAPRDRPTPHPRVSIATAPERAGNSALLVCQRLA